MSENDPAMPATCRDADPLDRLPHAGASRLPGRVLRLIPSVRVEAERKLASGDGCLNESGCLPSALLVELMAQVGGLLMDEAGDGPGGYAVLAGVRGMHLHDTARAGETVEVVCELSRRIGDLYLIDCRARTGVRELAHGTIQIRRIRKGAP